MLRGTIHKYVGTSDIKQTALGHLNKWSLIICPSCHSCKTDFQWAVAVNGQSAEAAKLSPWGLSPVSSPVASPQVEAVTGTENLQRQQLAKQVDSF